MSHAMGEIIKGGRIVAYYEYNGTSDVVIPAAWATPNEVHEHWRSGEWKSCACGGPHEDVILYSSYGNGSHWPGKWCPRCRCITDGFRHDDDRLNPCRCDHFPCSCLPEWPKDGRPAMAELPPPQTPSPRAASAGPTTPPAGAPRA